MLSMLYVRNNNSKRPQNEWILYNYTYFFFFLLHRSQIFAKYSQTKEIKMFAVIKHWHKHFTIPSASANNKCVCDCERARTKKPQKIARKVYY